MTDQDHGPDLERAREQGRAQERPFAGVAGVPFPTAQPGHRAVRDYEQLLVDAHPRVWERAVSAQATVERLFEDQDQIGADLTGELMRTTGRSPRAWLHRRLRVRVLEQQLETTLDELHRATARRDQTDRDQAALTEELPAVRAWLDQWVEEAAVYAHERTWRRRPLSGPPAWVRTYPSSASFIAENPRRAGENFRPHDTGGRDHRSQWTWTDPARPGAKPMRWRVSWLWETGEVYAVRRAAGDNGVPGSGGHDDPEPVWLLASLPETHLFSDADEAVEKHLTSLEHLHDVPRESLLALADAVRATDWDAVLPGPPAAG